MAIYQAAALDDAGAILGTGKSVVLEPDQWLGRRFPLLGYVDIGEQLAEGDWVAVLFHHDCPVCKRVIPEYEWSATTSSTTRGAPLLAFVEMAPYDGRRNGPDASCSSSVRGRLSSTRNWFLKTPVEIRLREGKVIRVMDSQGIAARFPRVKDAGSMLPFSAAVDPTQ